MKIFRDRNCGEIFVYGFRNGYSTEHISPTLDCGGTELVAGDAEASAGAASCCVDVESPVRSLVALDELLAADTA